MIQKKREQSQIVGNATTETLRLRLELKSAIAANDTLKINKIQKRLDDLSNLNKAPGENSVMKNLAQVNLKNRLTDLKAGREAELAALAKKRQVGTIESDPFARLKTNPVHVFSR